MSSIDDGLNGFYARASQDVTLKTVLGTKTGVSGTPARIYEGWPDDTLTASDFPRVTYFLVSSRTRRPGIFSLRVQVDGWFWQSPGWATKRKTWTDRMHALFDEQSWLYGSSGLYATATPGRDYPATSDRPARRLIELRIEVSPSPVI